MPENQSDPLDPSSFQESTPRILPSRSLKRPKSDLLNIMAVMLLFALLVLLRILNSTISQPLQPRLPLTFTYPTGSFLSLRIGSSRACPLLSSWKLPGLFVVCCCLSNRYQGGSVHLEDQGL